MARKIKRDSQYPSRHQYREDGHTWILNREYPSGRWWTRREQYPAERWYLPGESRDTAVHYLGMLSTFVEGA